MTPTKFEDFTSPLYIMAKAAGPKCNLNCKYCYYTEKSNLYKDSKGDSAYMSPQMLDLYIRKYIEAQSMPQVLFTWHGGEPMLRPLSFYKQALSLQRHYGRGRHIDNCIQTNGTLINDDWARFLKDNNWLVGVSIDGPEHMHDTYRRNRGDKPTFKQVMHGIELLNKYGVDWNAMAVVNDVNVEHPEEFYQFFKDIDCHYIQFTPIVERISNKNDGRHLASVLDVECPVAPFSVTPEKWGDFLCRVFDQWVKSDVGNYFVQIFDATLANWVGVTPGLCSMAKTCGHAGVMEHNGDVYSCDHFVFPEYRLGNIRTKTFVEMMYSTKQYAFGDAKLKNLPNQCRQCKYLFACNGECPKNRFKMTEDGEKGLNYLCRGYYQFFSHTAPYMRFMRDELRAGRPASNVMDNLQNL